MAEINIEPFAYQKSTNIDEHNQIVDKVNEIIENVNGVNLDGLDERLTTDETNIAKNTSDIEANTQSITNVAGKVATNTENIESLRNANIIITKDIEGIKETDVEQSKDITALGNKVVNGVNTAFDNSTRVLKTTVKATDGTSYESEVNIPATGETGDDYTASNPIDITNKNISLKIDDATMEITSDGKLKSKASGTDVSATAPITIDSDGNIGLDYGNGLTLDADAIKVDMDVVADKATVDNHTAQISELSTKVTNVGTIANEAFANANVCYDDVSIADNVLTFTTVEGNTKEITLPSRITELTPNVINLYNISMDVEYTSVGTDQATYDLYINTNNTDVISLTNSYHTTEPVLVARNLWWNGSATYYYNSAYVYTDQFKNTLINSVKQCIPDDLYTDKSTLVIGLDLFIIVDNISYPTFTPIYLNYDIKTKTLTFANDSGIIYWPHDLKYGNYKTYFIAYDFQAT